MSVVIMGHLYFHLNTIYFLPISFFVIAIVGISRIYSRARFPHQIIGSYFTGFLGLLVSMEICDRIAFHEMTHHDHGFCVGAIGVFIIAGLGLSMESNQNYLLYIPKKEFIRVISEIITGGGRGVSQNDKELDDSELYDETSMNDDGSSNVLYDSNLINTKRSVSSNSTLSSANNTSRLVKESPRSQAMQKVQSLTGNTLSRRKTYVKSDSLYFLQKAMEERETKLQSEMLMLDPNHGNLASKNKRNYGAEDFFSSSDSEYDD
jgi:hypothetical protein